MMEHILTDYGDISFFVNRSARRKNAYITIDRGVVLVKLPARANDGYAAQLVRQKAKWITGKLRSQPEDYKDARKYVQGELFEILGEPYALEIEFNDKNRFCADALDGRLLVSIPQKYETAPREYVKRAVDSFYTDLTCRELERCVPELEKILGVSPAKLAVRPLKTAWGLCYTNGTITINRCISRFPRSIIDYLALHELCHLIRHDHSREYWELVQSCMPDYKQRRAALKARYPQQ